MESQFPTDAPIGNELRQYIALLRRWLWLLVLATILAGGAAYFASQQITPIYEASTTVLIREADNSIDASDYRSIITSERLASTYAEMMRNTPILEAVIEQVDQSMRVRALRQSISVQPIRDTQLIEIRVEDTDPERAANVANVLVAVFSERNQEIQTSRFASSKESLRNQLDDVEQQIQETRAALDGLDEGSESAERVRLEATLRQYEQTYASLLQSFEQVRVAEAQSTSGIVQVEPATTPLNPVRPRTLTNTLLAAVVGMMLAVGGVFLYEYLDDTLKDPAFITEGLNLPILGLIATHESDGDGPIAQSQPRSPVTEAFRSLRTNIQYAGVDRRIRTLLVTSAEPGAGKSTVLSNFAVVLAQSGQNIVVVEGDLRRPALHRRMNVPNRSGLSDLFVHEDMPLEYVTQETQYTGLSVVTSGEKPPNPSELLGSAKMNNILGQLQGRFDRVVIDAPPLMAVTDAAVLAPHVDGVLLVAQPGQTKVPALQQAVRQLRHVGSNVIGVVLNNVKLSDARYGYYYDGYYYAYEDTYGDDSHDDLQNIKMQPRGSQQSIATAQQEVSQ